MSEPIKVGDLVQVVHSCCEKRVSPTVSTVVDVKQIWDYATIILQCAHCGAHLPKEMFACRSQGDAFMPLSWLKRIPPLSELEGEDRKEELTA